MAGACPAINEWGGRQNLRQFLLLLDAAAGPAAVTWSQSLSMKGPDRVGELTGAAANHDLDMRPAASFYVARVAFASSL